MYLKILAEYYFIFKYSSYQVQNSKSNHTRQMCYEMPMI